MIRKWPALQRSSELTIHLEMVGSTVFVAAPGQVTALPSSHDAWVVGDAPVIVVGWHGGGNYA